MGKMVLRYFQWNLRIVRVKNPKLEIRSPKEIRNPKSEFPLAPWNNIGTWTQVIRTAYSTGRAVGAGDLLCGTDVALRNRGFEIRSPHRFTPWSSAVGGVALKQPLYSTG